MRINVEPEGILGRPGLFSTDSATPLTAGTWMAAKTGANCAINAAHALRLGERGTFALTRPPGQHAGADYYGAVCFLNNVAPGADTFTGDPASHFYLASADLPATFVLDCGSVIAELGTNMVNVPEGFETAN